ncbi:MAG: tRNA lysidine(34) synthetase TilS, partial [Candidatus Aenigmatarchaeota archaeon]
MVEETFRETIQTYSLLDKKDKIILGVSGGPDSICMLYLFSKIINEYKLKILCAHFNHSLRKEADSEEAFVKKICKDLGIKFISEKKEIYKLFKGNSLEQFARNLRLDFFIRCARKFKIKKVALAHHKDDVIETVLMRIIRGSGLKGLRGILPISKFKGITFIRPLINLRKTEILNWLKINDISYCIDKTNFEEKFFRNKIRLKLLPLLEEFNPNITNTIFNLAKTSALDYELIYTITKEKFALLKKQKTANYIQLDLEEIKKMPLALLFNIILLVIEELKKDTRKLEFRHLEEIFKLVHNKSNLSKIYLPDLEIIKEDNWLII